MTEKQEIIQSHINVERAIDELRRQLGIIIETGTGPGFCIYPIEFLEQNLLAEFPTRRLLLTGARARVLKLTTLGDEAVSIDASALSLPQLKSLADPLAEQTSLPPLNVATANEAEKLALRLAKYASLLPALLVAEKNNVARDWVVVSTGCIRVYIDAPLIDMVQAAEARLPIDGAENTKLLSFRSRYSVSVHLALIVGNARAEKNPLVRVHSSCVTGDILGSLRCDCGDQLKLALSQIIAHGSGILIYLHQEGRGIGITNKLRAYCLQEQGLDTFDANLMLGFCEDERDFSLAAAILKNLGITGIRMLTNNPHKMAAVEKAGVKVVERVPLIAMGGKHNHAYLEAKSKKAGHLF